MTYYTHFKFPPEIFYRSLSVYVKSRLPSVYVVLRFGRLRCFAFAFIMFCSFITSQKNIHNPTANRVRPYHCLLKIFVLSTYMRNNLHVECQKFKIFSYINLWPRMTSLPHILVW